MSIVASSTDVCLSADALQTLENYRQCPYTCMDEPLKLNADCHARYSIIPSYMDQTHQSHVLLCPGIEHAELFAHF